MKASTLFHLAIRLLGLVFLYHALAIFPEAVSRMFNLFYGASLWSFGEKLLAIGVNLLVACWLFVGAPPIGQLAYPENREDTDREVSDRP